MEAATEIGARDAGRWSDHGEVFKFVSTIVCEVVLYVIGWPGFVLRPTCCLLLVAMKWPTWFSELARGEVLRCCRFLVSQRFLVRRQRERQHDTNGCQLTSLDMNLPMKDRGIALSLDPIHFRPNPKVYSWHPLKNVRSELRHGTTPSQNQGAYFRGYHNLAFRHDRFG